MKTKKRFFFIFLLVLIAMPAVAHRRSSLRVSTRVYDPTHTNVLVSEWRPFIGGNEALLLGKLGTTYVDSAGIGEFEGLSRVRLTELGFDVFKGGQCTGGAPRLNVITDQGYLYFFGCYHGTRTDSPDRPETFSRVRFTDASAFPQYAENPPWPGFGVARITRIQLVFDEGTDTGSGFTALDNFDVNGTLIGSSKSGRDDDDCDDDRR